MTLKIGDPVFTRRGQPGVIVGRDDRSQRYESKIENEAVRTAFRHGYVKGMEEEMRHNFNAIMDDLQGIEDAEERMNSLQGTIEKLELDADNGPDSQRLVRYLKSELFHLMRTHNVSPKEYKIPYFEVFNS